MATVVQPSFVRGELSPKVHGRIDIDQYGQGVVDSTNFAVLVQGPLRKRPGTGYISTTKDASAKSCLLPFIFSTKQAYVLEFGNFYIRFFALRGQVKNGTVPYEIQSPYAIEDVPFLKYLEINDIVYITHNKYPIHKLTRKAELDWTIAPVDFIDGPYLDVNLTSTTVTPSNNGRPSGTGLPANWWDLDPLDLQVINFKTSTISFSFSGSPVIVDGYSFAYCGALSDGSFQAYNIACPRAWTFEGLIPGTSTWVELDVRNGESNWIPGETRQFDFTNKTAYQAYRFLFKKNNGSGSYQIGISEIYLKVKDLPMTLTFSSIIGINRNTGFTNDDIGRYIRFRTADGFWKNFKITAVTSSTIVQGLYHGTWTDTISSTVSWQLGSFSKFSGYPAAVSDFEGRLVFGGTLEQPRNVWFSSSINLEDFAPKDPLSDSSPINITLSGNQQNAILWMTPGKGLFVGTTEGITVVTSGSDEPLSYKAIKQAVQTNFGANFIAPVRVGPAVLYISYYANCVRELLYAFSDDTYDAPDISMLSEHLMSSGITEIGWSKSPVGKLFMTTNSGVMTVMTYDRVQKVVGFAPFATDGSFESIAVIPGIDGTQDDVYVQVKRTINGETKRYIEYFNYPFDEQTVDKAWFVDSGLKYEGSYTNTISGLGHLEGKIVAITVIGSTDSTDVLSQVPPIFGATVVGGQIKLPSGVTTNNAIIGLPYTATCKVLKTRIPGKDGETLYTRNTRVDRVVLDLYRSAGLEINGDGTETWEDVIERVAYNRMDESIPLFTGLKDITVEGTWKAGSVFTVRAQYPLPALIRAITSKIDKEA